MSQLPSRPTLALRQLLARLQGGRLQPRPLGAGRDSRAFGNDPARSGGSPRPPPGYANADLQFNPEINDAFELGAKYNGRGFDVNVALFRQLFRNFQLNTFNGVNLRGREHQRAADDLDGADTDNVIRNDRRVHRQDQAGVA